MQSVFDRIPTLPSLIRRTFGGNGRLAGEIAGEQIRPSPEQNRDKYIGEFERRRGNLPVKVDG